MLSDTTSFRSVKVQLRELLDSPAVLALTIFDADFVQKQQQQQHTAATVSVIAAATGKTIQSTQISIPRGQGEHTVHLEPPFDGVDSSFYRGTYVEITQRRSWWWPRSSVTVFRVCDGVLCAMCSQALISFHKMHQKEPSDQHCVSANSCGLRIFTRRVPNMFLYHRIGTGQDRKRDTRLGPER